ncbi:hypothetical protein HpHA63_09740 [Helicobacter pylori]
MVIDILHIAKARGYGVWVVIKNHLTIGEISETLHKRSKHKKKDRPQNKKANLHHQRSLML